MGQKKITLELTEYEARGVGHAGERTAVTAPRQLRGQVFEQKLASSLAHVKERVQGIKALPPARWPR